jgi:hypothetical protein
LWVARQTGLEGHFLFSAKFICMGNLKNRLTATKPQNHFARIFFKVCMQIDLAFLITMMVFTLSSDAWGRLQVRSKFSYRVARIRPTLYLPYTRNLKTPLPRRREHLRASGLKHSSPCILLYTIEFSKVEKEAPLLHFSIFHHFSHTLTQLHIELIRILSKKLPTR